MEREFTNKSKRISTTMLSLALSVSLGASDMISFIKSDEDQYQQQPFLHQEHIHIDPPSTEHIKNSITITDATTISGNKHTLYFKDIIIS